MNVFHHGADFLFFRVKPRIYHVIVVCCRTVFAVASNRSNSCCWRRMLQARHHKISQLLCSPIPVILWQQTPRRSCQWRRLKLTASNWVIDCCWLSQSLISSSCILNIGYHLRRLAFQQCFIVTTVEYTWCVSNKDLFDYIDCNFDNCLHATLWKKLWLYFSHWASNICFSRSWASILLFLLQTACILQLDIWVIWL